jgi:serine/threonine-protein kinase
MPDLLERLTAALADRYAVESEIGRGGMAAVFLAEDLKHHRKVAVKVMHPEISSDVATERFFREIEIVAGLTHPHILPLHDSGQADGLLYCVVPYIEGESLLDRLLREKQLPVEDALQITREVAEALGYAHERGIIHRDIKPANILLQHGHALVADFGIARAVEQAGGARITQTAVAVGTPAYMSPEQGGGSADLDGRSDIYSLGCVLYEMLAGEPPYTGVTPQAVIRRHSLDPVPSVRTIRDTVPESAGHAITKALAKIPADRFATAILFAQALQSCNRHLADQPEGGKRPGKLWRCRTCRGDDSPGAAH